MNLTIESPAMGSEAWSKFVIDRFGDQMKNFNALDNLIRKSRPVESDDRGVVLSWLTRRELPSAAI
jgi:hypothetical protein